MLAWVDPERGRLLVATPGEGEEGRTGDLRVWVDFHVGAGVDLGGGGYPREAVPAPGEVGERWTAVVTGEPGWVGDGEVGERVHVFATLDEALAAWNRQRVPPIPARDPRPRSPRDGVIVLADGALHPVRRRLDLRGRRLLVQAADGCVPTLVGDLVVRGPERRAEGLWESRSRAPSLENQLVLDGLWIDGSVELDGDTSLTVRHSTVVPVAARREGGTAAAIRVSRRPRSRLGGDGAGSGGLAHSSRLCTVRVHHSVVSGVDLGRLAVELGVAASLVDGDVSAPAGEVHFARSTVTGSVTAGRMAEAVDTLFAGTVEVELRGTGRLRSSWLPAGSRTPPRERCGGVPAAAEGGGVLFRSTRFGDPAYGMLADGEPAELREGASDGNEIGVFNGLRQSDRLADLDVILDEYLPVGMTARVWFAT